LGVVNDFPLSRRCKQILASLNVPAENSAELAATT
jgi:hypothetical protein